MVVPYLPTVGFDYNRNYFSHAAIFEHFRLNGYQVEHVEKTFYRFSRDDVHNP